MTIKDTEYSKISLPSAPWVSSPGLVMLYHTLLITKKPSSSSSSSLLRHVFDENCLKTWSWKGSLGCQPVLCLPHLNAMGQSDCHHLQPSGRRKVLSKNMFLLRIFAPSESHTKLQAGFNILTPSLLRSWFSLWPPVPVFHTAVYYFDQYPPFPLLSLPLSPP